MTVIDRFKTCFHCLTDMLEGFQKDIDTVLTGLTIRYCSLDDMLTIVSSSKLDDI